MPRAEDEYLSEIIDGIMRGEIAGLWAERGAEIKQLIESVAASNPRAIANPEKVMEEF